MIQTRNIFQRNTSWNAPYTFSGKEKDAETGYGYVKKLRFFSSLAFGNEKQVFHYAHCLRRFGARYYDSGLSIWLSVDPMSDERSWVTPYNYCQNNPIVITDKSGALDDGYTIDDDGNIVRVSNVGGDNYDVLYDKEAYDKGKRDYDASGSRTGIIIYDKKFIPAMRKITHRLYTSHYDFNSETGEYKYYDIFVSTYNTKSNTNKEQKSKTNYGGLFFFLANNCKDIEWAIGRTFSGDLCIGTFRSDSQGPSPKDFGLKASDFDSYLHSHNTKDVSGEYGSLGSDRDAAGDFNIFQVYFPYSGNLHVFWKKNGKTHYGSKKL